MPHLIAIRNHEGYCSQGFGRILKPRTACTTFLRPREFELQGPCQNFAANYTGGAETRFTISRVLCLPARSITFSRNITESAVIFIT